MPDTDTIDLVVAYVAHNHLAAAELPALIATVHGALARLDDVSATAAAPEADVAKPGPGEIRKSIRPDGLVSFIDGRSYKTLKRHLTKHGLDPASYRERYGLPADYPMTSAAYSAARSALAKATGLGVPGGRAEPRQAAE